MKLQRPRLWLTAILFIVSFLTFYNALSFVLSGEWGSPFIEEEKIQSVTLVGTGSILDKNDCKYKLSYRIDSAFTSGEKKLIIEAARRWYVASDHRICFTIRDVKIQLEEVGTYMIDNVTTIYSCRTAWQQMAASMKHSCLFNCMAVTVGYKGSKYGDIFMVDRDSSRFLKVVIHEMGHLLGLGHSPSDGDIMAEHITDSDRISSDDISVLKCILDNNLLAVWERETCSYEKVNNNVDSKGQPSISEQEEDTEGFPNSVPGWLPFDLPEEEFLGLGEQGEVVTIRCGG